MHSYCFSSELEQGFVVASVIEVTAIPDISIIEDERNKDVDIELRYIKNFTSLLSELYQVYKTTNNFDISFELMWKTSPVSNQAYSAGIRLFLVTRVIADSFDLAKESVGDFNKILNLALHQLKYDYQYVDNGSFDEVLSSINASNLLAIKREERFDNLQNQYMNACYAFDRIEQSNESLSRISNTLIEYENCLLSIQLIPTKFLQNELAYIENNVTILETLDRGVTVAEQGNIAFALARNCADLYKYYADRKSSPVFIANITIWGNSEAVRAISSRVGSQVNTANNTVSLKTIDLSEYDIVLNRDKESLPWYLNELIQEVDRSTSNIDLGENQFISRLPYLFSAEESSELFRLPIGSNTVSAGLNVSLSSKKNKNYASSIVNGGDIDVGKLRSSSRGDSIGFFLKDLTKHMLVVGTPGSGKTTFSVSLLDRLWKDHKIPFLVVEPAKNEYRALVQSIPDIQIFTPGKNFISPFVYNPFVPPQNVSLETYKSVLKTAFAAGVTMTSPLDKIFEETVNNCYSDFRWLGHYTSADKGKNFSISDFIKTFQQTFDEIGYVGEAKNIGRAGSVRLKSLINLFDNYHSIPVEDILSKPTIIELAAIENSDQKALIIALLLLNILSYVNKNYVGEGDLKNVILLEEAHVLLDSESSGGEGSANPSAIAIGLLKRMLAEIRSYGVGLVIADQSPRKVTSDVVALTNIKLAFRLVEASDKQILADSTNMTQAQIDRLSKLKPGESFLFFDKLEDPEEVVTPDYRADNDISISLSDESIKELSQYWKGREYLLRPYPECDCGVCCKNNCDFSCRNLGKEISRRLIRNHLSVESKDFAKLRKIYGNIRKLSTLELNDEELTDRLLYCIKVQFLRSIKYNTKIKISDSVINKTLSI